MLCLSKSSVSLRFLKVIRWGRLYNSEFGDKLRTTNWFKVKAVSSSLVSKVKVLSSLFVQQGVFELPVATKSSKTENSQ